MADNVELAKEYHDREHQFGFQVAQFASENAARALKSVLLINGGAAIALLAFIGNFVAADEDRFADRLAELIAPVIWFAWGVALSVISMAFAYLTLYCAANRSHSRDRVWDHPYNVDTAASRRWHVGAVLTEVIATITGFTSLGCFLWGMYAVREAIIGAVQ